MKTTQYFPFINYNINGKQIQKREGEEEKIKKNWCFFQKKRHNIWSYQKKTVPLHRNSEMHALLAQLVEQLTLNQWVQGSSP